MMISYRSLKSVFIFSIFIFIPLFPIRASNVDGFVLHVIPKCGTHFAMRTVHLLTGKPVLGAPTLIQAILNHQDSGSVSRIFGPYDKSIAKYLENSKIKLVTVYRDPRDALVWMLFYMRSYKGRGNQRDFFTVSSDFDKLSLEQQLQRLITGGPGMPSYLTYFMERIWWSRIPFAYRMKYEDLIGSGGGGSDEKQKEAIVGLANYLQMDLSEERLDFVMKNMYVSRPDINVDEKLFARATFGNWKTFFTDKHKAAFKKRAGLLLQTLGYEKDSNW